MIAVCVGGPMDRKRVKTNRESFAIGTSGELITDNPSRKDHCLYVLQYIAGIAIFRPSTWTVEMCVEELITNYRVVGKDTIIV